MKLKNCSLMFLCFSLFLISCAKDGSNGIDGSNGKDGKDGTNGTNGVGTNGTNGKDGKTTLTRTTKEPAGANCTYGGTKFETGLDANNNGILDNSEVTTTQTTYVCNGAGAFYSSWIDVNVTDTLPKLKEEAYNYKQVLPAEALTADIINNGQVVMYYKNKNGVIFTVGSTIAVRDYTTDGYAFNFYPGYIFKEKYLSFLMDSYRDAVNDNGSAIRYLLIPGTAQARSVTDLQKMPYSEVAKLYNIND